MSEAKHTPGPWKAGRADMATLVDGVDSKWVYAGDQYVAVASGRIDGEWDEVMANARLIAAAPELLEALKGLLRARVNGVRPGKRVWDVVALNEALPVAHTAIQKARGQ